MADGTETTETTAHQVAGRPLAGYATFERRRIVLSEGGVDLVRKKTLSPSTAAAISSCGGRFAVERLLERLVPRPKDPLGAAELGTATHQVFEDLFARPKGERGLLAGAQLLERLEVDHPELEAPSDPELLARWRSEVQTRVVGLWEVESPDEIDVVARELHVTVDLDGVPFNGYIDRVHRGGDGLWVTDFKGGAGSMKKESARSNVTMTSATAAPMAERPQRRSDRGLSSGCRAHERAVPRPSADGRARGPSRDGAGAARGARLGALARHATRDRPARPRRGLRR